ncbi:ATP-dependent nuclease [Luteolibacter luteus]|uniref:ATP-binding protein n=1 Tax=Luteolibacter luteus TaxID=2728835 RepID=A0A858RH82_9BACT|nr:AAA family ATPase [Luteolibacter luteus]QJE96237.1 ATP-binding protein [Luteolibacter luteus]
MRDAKISDNWRNLSNRPDKFPRIYSIESRCFPNVPNEEIKFNGPISVIAGLNGVGKSTLLHCVALLLGWDQKQLCDNFDFKTSGGTFSVKILEGDKVTDFSADLSNGNIDLPDLGCPAVVWINTGADVPEIVRKFRRETNLEELLAQVSPVQYSTGDVELASAAVGKVYNSCEVYELEDFGMPFPVPYFRVTAHGVTYGTERMGLGEAAIHYIFWHLRRLQKRSIILLEEPESYISSRSQKYVIDLLAKDCLKKNCSALLTTHSPQIVSNVPVEWTIVLSRLGGSQYLIAESQESLREMLGMPPVQRKSGLIIVEDECAKLLASEWFRRFSLDFLKSWKIVTHKSAGDILKAVREFPNRQRYFKLVGLLDGNERGKHDLTGLMVTYLPSILPPNVLFQNVIQKFSDRVATALGISHSTWVAKLSTMIALDHHDWFDKLIGWLSANHIPPTRVVEVAFDLWLESGGRDEAEKQFIELLMMILQEQ